MQQIPDGRLHTDADNDKNLDLVVPTTRGELKIAYGAGDGTFPTVEPTVRGGYPVPRATISAAWSDLNGDQLPDLLLVARTAPFVWVGMNTSVAQPTQ